MKAIEQWLNAYGLNIEMMARGCAEGPHVVPTGRGRPSCGNGTRPRKEATE